MLYCAIKDPHHGVRCLDMSQLISIEIFANGFLVFIGAVWCKDLEEILLITC